MTPFAITVHASEAGPVLRIAGDLDFNTASGLREEVRRVPLDPGRLLILDLTDLTFCDSSGISALIAARNRAVAAGAGIALAAVPPNTARILGIVGLDKVFPIHPDAATAAKTHETP
ncbi:STAS domain-containing protein [Actinomadura fibrosa]|uniref:Anti-sigma factor antagonist n=1 Tax=Actinomadura fibrosa TaxID=111802 RepID=A0ABW2Y6S6_9ACTN|nr:STAS domain-containing protein [Actinomadura fibrosa]